WCSASIAARCPVRRPLAVRRERSPSQHPVLRNGRAASGGHAVSDERFIGNASMTSMGVAPRKILDWLPVPNDRRACRQAGMARTPSDVDRAGHPNGAVRAPRSFMRITKMTPRAPFLVVLGVLA